MKWWHFTKWMLSVSLLLSLLFSTSAAQYGNAYFLLETWGTLRPDSIPASLADCLVDAPGDPGYPLQLWTHNSYEFVWIAVRLAKVPDGYVGAEFGFWNECSGEDMSFLFFRTCPGLIQLPQTVDPPAACFVVSQTGCKPWRNYVGYFLYMANPGANCRFVVVPNADSDRLRILNCRGGDYPGSGALCCAQYSATQTVWFSDDPGGPACFGCNVVSVQSSTWGRLKALYK